MVKVIIWNEFIHEVENNEVKSIYPNGIHNCIKDFLSNDKSLTIETATLREKENFDLIIVSPGAFKAARQMLVFICALPILS